LYFSFIDLFSTQLILAFNFFNSSTSGRIAIDVAAASDRPRAHNRMHELELELAPLDL
jgi:hypothetical protein